MMDKSSVYLDACCFIDVVKFDVNSHLENEKANEVWYIKKLLQAHRDREINVFTSTLTIAEATNTGINPVPSNVQRSFEALLTSGQYVTLVQTTPFVCMDARNLRWNEEINLKGADSVHLASALERNCGEFISFDGRFGRIDKHSNKLTAKGIAVRTPSKTSALPGKYLQENIFDDQGH